MTERRAGYYYVWFDVAEPDRPWIVQHPDGHRTKAREVRLRSTTDDVEPRARTVVGRDGLARGCIEVHRDAIEIIE